MKKYELLPIYDSSQSFYGKAKVIEYDNQKKLYSYDTFILSIENGKITFNKNVKQDLLFSHTTLRHIKEFLKQNGFKADTKNQIMSDYFDEVTR